MQIIRYSDIFSNFWRKMLGYIFFKEKFSTLATLTAVSDITSTILHCMKTLPRILQFFCYENFKELLAPITFAKNFGLLASVVSKIITFATNNNGNQYQL